MSINTPPELYRQHNAILILYYLKDNGGRFFGNFSNLCDLFKISRRQGDYAVQILVEKNVVCAENVKGKKLITRCGIEDCKDSNANPCENCVQTADIAEEKEKKGSPHTPFKEDKEKKEKKKKKKKGTRFAENLETRKAKFVEDFKEVFPKFVWVWTTPAPRKQPSVSPSTTRPSRKHWKWLVHKEVRDYRQG